LKLRLVEAIEGGQLSLLLSLLLSQRKRQRI